MRLTRYHLLLGAALVAGVLIAGLFTDATRWVLLGLLCVLASSCAALGVSVPRWRMFGQSLCRVRTAEKAVALTFDDGPDPETTPALLALLAKRGVRATFFCVGSRVARFPALALRLVSEGHQVENHSFDHRRLTNLLSTARLRADLARAQRAIGAVTGQAPRLFRPPMCLTNPRVFRVAAELGLQITACSARGWDRRPDPPESIAWRLLRRLEPGAVFLLHDGGVPARRLLPAVDLLLDGLQASGYRCLRLDELAASANPYLKSGDPRDSLRPSHDCNGTDSRGRSADA